MKKSVVLLLTLIISFQLKSQDLSELFEKVSGSVVLINTTEKEIAGGGSHGHVVTNEGLGSGVLISEDGTILTAAHVVQLAENIEVIFKDGQKIPAKQVGTDNIADVAMIKLMWPPKNPTVAKLGDSEKVKVGERIFVIGSPYGLNQSLSSGYISGKHKKKAMGGGLTLMEFFQTDAAINQGNSGGPMFNMQGDIIGIVSYILSMSGGFQGLGFAATSNIAKSILIDQKSGWTGMESTFVSGELARIFNLPQSGAVYVQKVASLSPADIAGLKGGVYKSTIEGEDVLLGGDFILEIEGIKMVNENSLIELHKIVEPKNKGDKLALKVLRGGKIIDMTYILPN